MILEISVYIPRLSVGQSVFQIRISVMHLTNGIYLMEIQGILSLLLNLSVNSCRKYVLLKTLFTTYMILKVLES